ncbi:MAG: glutathione S-transferase [Alphaproteobacteria bacterium]|nr:glutathione S-transferase [Alphaproteobacteria bacterium]
MIIVHHLEDSRSQRILWLLEELGLDYEIKRYLRDKETRLAPKALKDVHPLGKSPVIEDNGIVVAETGAIVEYLVGEHGGGDIVAPMTAEEKRQYTYWLHFAEGSLMPQLLLKLFFTQVKEAKMPFFAKPIAKGIADRVLGSYVDPNIETQFAFINDHLARNAWFAGDAISGADIMMSFPLEAGADRAGAGKLKAIKGYLEKIHARPAYARALERGGPYVYA